MTHRALIASWPRLNRSALSIAWVGLAVLSAVLFFPSDAHAQALEDTICKIVVLTTGCIGKPVASAAVIAICGMAMFGRISWGTVMVTVSGIAIIFSASQLTLTLTGKTACAGTADVCSGGGGGGGPGGGSGGGTGGGSGGGVGGGSGGGTGGGCTCFTEPPCPTCLPTAP